MTCDVVWKEAVKAGGPISLSKDTLETLGRS